MQNNISNFYDDNRPQLKISIDAYKKMKAYADISSPKEIGGLGIISSKDRIFVLEDVVIVEQTVDSAECELQADSIAAYIEEMMENGGDPSKIRCWWHSHATMKAFWSGTDQDTITKWGSNDLIAVVVNVSGDIEACYMCKSPAMVVNMDVSIDWGLSEDQMNKIREEVKKKCTYLPPQNKWSKNNKSNNLSLKDKIIEHTIIDQDIWDEEFIKNWPSY